MIQDVEELRAKLKFLGLCNADVLEQREIPVRIARALRDVASGRSELLHRGDGIRMIR